jgi:hypothetical protein
MFVHDSSHLFFHLIIEYNSKMLDNVAELIKLIFIEYLVKYLNGKSILY